MTPWDKWAWARLLEALDKAGYAVVKKPVLTDKGLPHREPR